MAGMEDAQVKSGRHFDSEIAFLSIIAQ